MKKELFQKIICKHCKKKVNKIDCYNINTGKHFGFYCIDCIDTLIDNDPELEEEFMIEG